MLINKWLITDTIRQYDPVKNRVGICLNMPAKSADFSNIYKSVQLLPAEVPFTLLFSEKNFDTGSKHDSYIYDVLGFFFLSSYYLQNYQPVVFIEKKSQPITDFLNRLNEKCKKQGIKNILIKEINCDPESPEKFTYLINNMSFDLNAELKKWVITNIKGNSPPEINLLASADKGEIIDNLSNLENKLKETEEYKIADVLYQKQRLIDELNHQLYLKTINEKNIQAYLNIQKEERASGLKWYYYEYEILPTWYKQIGHIIKVIMGKRTFKSLFNDNVKKYKD